MRAARILVLRGGALGDFVVTLPALAALRDRWPDGYLELVGYPHIADLARAGGLADQVTSLHGAGIARFFSLAPQFPEEQVAWLRSFDFVLSYLHDPEGVVVDNLKRAGARTVLYRSPLLDHGHAIDHLVHPLESLALYARGAAARLDLGPAARAEGRQLAERNGVTGPFAVLHPGSGSPRKNWPLARFLEAAERLQAERGWTPILLTGEADQKLAAQLAATPTGFPHLNDLSLPEAAHLLSAAEFYLGNDSGITHLAAALGTPTGAIFGPTDPAQWAPRGGHVRVVQAPGGAWEALGVDDVLGPPGAKFFQGR